MFGKQAMGGMGMPQADDEKSMKMNAVKDMLDKIRAVIGTGSEDKGSEGDDYLDPDSLGKDDASKGGDVLAALGKDGGDENESPEEESSESPDDEAMEGESPMSAMGAMGGASDKLDPEELMNFFNKKAGDNRKPLKGMKVGMTEVSMSPLGKGMMKKRM